MASTNFPGTAVSPQRVSIAFHRPGGDSQRARHRPPDTLVAAVWRRLDELDRMAIAGRTTSTARVDSEMCRLTTGWRALLAQHTTDRRGRCRSCRTRVLRKQACPIWSTAYRHLVLTAPATTRRTARRRTTRPVPLLASS
jgi:hypothetical protein